MFCFHALLKIVPTSRHRGMKAVMLRLLKINTILQKSWANSSATNFRERKCKALRSNKHINPYTKFHQNPTIYPKNEDF